MPRNIYDTRAEEVDVVLNEPPKRYIVLSNGSFFLILLFSVILLFIIKIPVNLEKPVILIKNNSGPGLIATAEVDQLSVSQLLGNKDPNTRIFFDRFPSAQYGHLSCSSYTLSDTINQNGNYILYINLPNNTMTSSEQSIQLRERMTGKVMIKVGEKKLLNSF